MYVLYKYYGYGIGDIGKFFIVGFGSSMIFGIIVGSLVDRYGCKFVGLIYVVMYIVFCIMKYWSDYGVFMFGCFFGGIATSLLFIAFEFWFVFEYFFWNYDLEWLNGMFLKVIFIGNGVVLIVVGLLVNYLVIDMNFGFVASFDVAVTFLVIGGVIIVLMWIENRGVVNVNVFFEVSFLVVKYVIFNDKKVLYFGAM